MAYVFYIWGKSAFSVITIKLNDMANKFSFYFFSLLCFLLFSCGADNSHQKIVGKWQGISWKVEGTESNRNASEVHFEFKADKTYTAAFGQQKEEGTFYLDDTKLYTTAKGQAEKNVQIQLTATDTLVMDMNRAGTLEELVLVKK